LKRCFTIALACLLLHACGTFYPEPKPGEPAATLVESGERRAADWYEDFVISEIDGQPVSHMGKSLGTLTVQVAPGRRKIKLTATYLHGLKFAFNQNSTCPCRAVFPIDVDISNGKKFRVVGKFDETGSAKLQFIDSATGESLFGELSMPATPVPKTSYQSTPGGT
jgi:hypothetical protein